MRTFFPSIAILLLASSVARCDGTIPVSEVLESLGPTNPELVRVLKEGFDLEPDATATVIGRAVNEQLGGARIGPYTVHGRLRGTPAGAELTLTLDTEIKFLDRQQHPTQNVSNASSVKEKLTHIDIRVRGSGE
ncbi:MAG TPA: hypothetical protein VH325_18570 [Bryobacteraceae bacterium]|jgi:hypothetical protein|nr:hypothetical protein [Bryobacteraceae bacterium]